MKKGVCIINCARGGIIIVNSPTASSITVAEHTVGLMLSLARNIPFADASLKSRKWEKKKFLGIELRALPSTFL
jgi:D-3-phosphoglycerate dehydrogenase